MVSYYATKRDRHIIVDALTESEAREKTDSSRRMVSFCHLRMTIQNWQAVATNAP